MGTYASNAPTATTSDYQTSAFSLESKIVMNMLIKNTNLGADCYAVVTVDGDTKEYVVTSVQTVGSRSMFRFEGMAPALARSTVTWKFYKAGEDSATAEPSLVVTDSLENWVGRSLATNPEYEELMMYCDAAADYLKNK